MARCRKCGKSAFEIGNKYLARINPKGQEGVWECRPSCWVEYKDKDQAVISAILGE